MKKEMLSYNLNGGYTSANFDTCFNFNVYLNMFIIKCQGKKGKIPSATTRMIAMVAQNDFDTTNRG